MRITYLVLMAGLTFACGKIDKQEVKSEPLPGTENANGSQTIPPAFAVADATQLPPCTAAIEGQLVYAKKEATFATCTSLNWIKLDVGSVASTSSSGLQTSTYCNTTVTKADLVAAGLDTAPDGGINFDYSVFLFANKTRFVQGSISSATASYSKGTFWNEKQSGYATANTDDINFDVAGTADFGHFIFTTDKTLTGDEKNPYAIVYTDTSVPGGLLITFDAAKCFVNVY